jgi:hypothetical protein
MHGADSPREVSTTPPLNFIKSESEPLLNADMGANEALIYSLV